MHLLLHTSASVDGCLNGLFAEQITAIKDDGTCDARILGETLAFKTMPIPFYDTRLQGYAPCLDHISDIYINSSTKPQKIRYAMIDLYSSKIIEMWLNSLFAYIERSISERINDRACAGRGWAGLP